MGKVLEQTFTQRTHEDGQQHIKISAASGVIKEVQFKTTVM